MNYTLSTGGEVHAGAIDALAHGNIAALSNADRLAYYVHRCKAAGLDPASHPFQFLKLNGKVVLYATKAATNQLTARHKLSVTITERGRDGDLYVVTARAENGERKVDDMGAVDVSRAKGDNLCNAMLKAVTKAKRRAVLSFCGLGEMDETEVQGIRGAEPVALPVQKPDSPPAKAKPVPVADEPVVKQAASVLAQQVAPGETPPWDADSKTTASANEPDKPKRKPRACSKCREPGHTARTCGKQKPKAQVPDVAEVHRDIMVMRELCPKDVADRVGTDMDGAESLEDLLAIQKNLKAYLAEQKPAQEYDQDDW